MHAGQQRARHVGAQHQQLGHAFGRDHIAIDLAVDLEGRDAAQQGAPVIEVEVHQGATARHAVVVALYGMELHIQQARRVVGPLDKSAQAHKVQRLVLEHGAQRHTAPQVRAVFDPFEELRRILLPGILAEVALQRQPGLVLRFPGFRGQRPAHGTRVLARRLEAGKDGGRIGLVRHHELQHGFTIHHRKLRLEGRDQLADGQHALPATMGIVDGLRQHGGFIGNAEHARGVLCPLGVAGHPVKMIGGAAQHRPSLGREPRTRCTRTPYSVEKMLAAFFSARPVQRDIQYK